MLQELALPLAAPTWRVPAARIEPVTNRTAKNARVNIAFTSTGSDNWHGSVYLAFVQGLA